MNAVADQDYPRQGGLVAIGGGAEKRPGQVRAVGALAARAGLRQGRERSHDARPGLAPGQLLAMRESQITFSRA